MAGVCAALLVAALVSFRALGRVLVEEGCR